MQPYPVHFDVSPPARFDRVQLLLRLAILVSLGAIGGSLGWLHGLLYLLLPVVAAVLVSSTGPSRFATDGAPRIATLLRWFLAFQAYMALLTDRLPTRADEIAIRFDVEPASQPTVGSALLRWLLSVPAVLVAIVLGLLAGIACVLAALCVLASAQYPASLYAFQRGVVRYQARLFAYHASLVEMYPPLALDTGAESAPAIAAPLAV